MIFNFEYSTPEEFVNNYIEKDVSKEEFQIDSKTAIRKATNVLLEDENMLYITDNDIYQLALRILQKEFNYTNVNIQPDDYFVWDFGDRVDSDILSKEVKEKIKNRNENY